jgi:hypothetical protein
MKYWHPHLPFGQHISVSTLVTFSKKKNNKIKAKQKLYMSIIWFMIIEIKMYPASEMQSLPKYHYYCKYQ